jgi:hypothetical protein
LPHFATACTASTCLAMSISANRMIMEIHKNTL